MKKTLVALALAALPVASMADVVLYGQIKGGVEVSKDKGFKGTTTQIVDYGSRIGFKGHEHLNGSLKAIWQLEQKVDIAGGSATRGFGTRDSFIGLQSDAGTVKVGYQQTPLAQKNGDLDQWEYASDAAGLSTFTRGTAVAKRALGVSYQSPEFAGVSAQAFVAPSENNNGEEAGARSNVDSAVYGAGVSYKNAGFFADVAGGYAKRGALNPAKAGHQELVQVGYEGDKLFAGVAYQQARNVETANAAYKTQEVAASVAYKATDALAVKGSAAYGFNIKDLNNAKANGNGKYAQVVVGADYALSKRTQVNGQVGVLQVGKKADKARSGVVGVGLKHKF